MKMLRKRAKKEMEGCPVDDCDVCQIYEKFLELSEEE